MPGQWEKEKWYGTEYTCEKISCEFLDEIEKAATSSSADHISKLHLPHKNQLIPAKLEVDKKEVKEPAVAPIIVKNDGLARTWYKKDDRFWIGKKDLIVEALEEEPRPQKRRKVAQVEVEVEPEEDEEDASEPEIMEERIGRGGRKVRRPARYDD
ncbi:hypothetical protein F5883DRAFT_524145 [Diaporthe sp. PMI_573]|nr:hypothetical protein F5883DRAFT_524145 [Diaporthaceae sp. PMI_573]